MEQLAGLVAPRPLQLVRQKPKSFNCGQCCVAMLAGVTRKQANKVFGSKGGTTTKQVVRALKKLGLAPAERVRTFRSEGSLPATCLLRLKYAGRAHGHWVVYNAGLIYCPGRGIYPFAQLLAAAPGTTCASYLPVPLP